MSRPPQKLFLRAWILLALMALQLLTPFLHAHIGTPKLAGWHLHVQNGLQPDLHPEQLAARFTAQLTELAAGQPAHDEQAHEPPEIGVQDGALAGEGMLSLFIACSFAALALLSFILPCRSRTHPLPPTLFSPLRRRFQCAGSPPPALAPPAHS